MSTPYLNADPQAYLEISPVLEELSQSVLTPERLVWAHGISRGLISGRVRRRAALRELMGYIPEKPKRPIKYLRELEVGRLPHTTRNVVRYSGDYVDMLTKEMAIDLLGDKRARKRSLGINARALFEKGPMEHQGLFQDLGRFDYFLNNPGKHDMSDTEPREPRFSTLEAVVSICISLTLGERIVSLSPSAAHAVEVGASYSMGGHAPAWLGAEYTGDDVPSTGPDRL